MLVSRSLRRLAGSAALAFALTAGVAVAAAAPAHAASFPPIGSTVCHLSPATGLQCGIVNAVNLTVNFPGGTVHGLFRYSACASPRDRNAPIYQIPTGEQIGTVFGGGGGCQTFGLPLP